MSATLIVPVFVLALAAAVPLVTGATLALLRRRAEQHPPPPPSVARGPYRELAKVEPEPPREGPPCACRVDYHNPMAALVCQQRHLADGLLAAVTRHWTSRR